MNALPRANAIAYLNAHGADVRYTPYFLAPTEADYYLRALLAEIEFNPPEESRVFVHGRWFDIPRRQSGYGDDGTSYRFAGCAVPARPWQSAPALRQLREIVARRSGFEANFVLLNLYRDGRDCIGWHRDDETGLGPRPRILSLSLGARRDFQFWRQGDSERKFKVVTLALEHGSLLDMRDPTNKNWQHRLPRRGGTHPERIGARLNLTWRHVS